MKRKRRHQGQPEARKTSERPRSRPRPATGVPSQREEPALAIDPVPSTASVRGEPRLPTDGDIERESAPDVERQGSDIERD